MNSNFETTLLLCEKFDDFEVKSKKFLSTRFFVALLSLIGCAIMYLTRINLNVAILAMVNSTKSDQNTSNFTKAHEFQCPGNSHDSSVNLLISEFDWSPPEQGIVLGSFFYGYILPQIFAGRLSELYGAKYLIGFSILISGLVNLLTPVMVRSSFTVFIGSRVVLGFVQGIVFPAFYALFAKWIPEEEHSTFMPWLYVGITIGTVVASTGSGNMIESNFMGGWPSVFYVSGILALIWCMIWFSFITSNPSSHKWISKTELNYIRNHTFYSRQKKVRQSFPWKKILTSKSFNSVLIAKVTYGITFDFIAGKIPAYLQDVIHFPISESGYTYSLLMIGFAVTLLTCGFMADLIIKNTQLSKTTVRKIFQTISGSGMALTLILIPTVGCDRLSNIILLTMCMLSFGFTSGGDVPIVPDMTEEFAGTVFAIMNSMSSISGFVVPYFVGFIIDSNPNSMHLWSYAFYLSAIIDIFGTIIFVLYSSAEPQNWEISSDEKDDDFENEINLIKKN